MSRARDNQCDYLKRGGWSRRNNCSFTTAFCAVQRLGEVPGGIAKVLCRKLQKPCCDLEAQRRTHVNASSTAVSVPTLPGVRWSWSPGWSNMRTSELCSFWSSSKHTSYAGKQKTGKVRPANPHSICESLASLWSRICGFISISQPLRTDRSSISQVFPHLNASNDPLEIVPSRLEKRSAPASCPRASTNALDWTTVLPGAQAVFAGP